MTHPIPSNEDLCRITSRANDLANDCHAAYWLETRGEDMDEIGNAMERVEYVRSDIAATEADALRDDNERLHYHLGRMLWHHTGRWHPNSILQREYGHEIDAARAALEETKP